MTNLSSRQRIEPLTAPSRLGSVQLRVHRREVDDTGRWVWLLHGRGAGADDLIPLMGRLVAAMDDGRLPAASLAAPDGPWLRRTHWWVDSAGEGQPTAVESALLDDVLPAVEGGATTDRGVVGISMGGAAACRWALALPHLVGWAALLSPAAYDLPPLESSARTSGAFGAGSLRFDDATYRGLMAPAALLAARPAGTAPATGIAVTVGDGEPPQHTPDGDPADLTLVAARLHTRLRRRADVRSDLRVVEGGHDFSVWEREVVDAVRRAQRLATGG